MSKWRAPKLIYYGPKCIAYRDDGKICGRPAFNVDVQRGGLVCNTHAPTVQSTTDPEYEVWAAERKLSHIE